MTDLLDAIDALTKPVVTHFPQIADDGKWLRAHTTTLPSLLEQLEAAVHSSTSGKAGGGNPAARSVLNSDALYEFVKIRTQIRDWCHAEKVAPSKDAGRDLRAWYAARLSRDTDDTWHTHQLHKWAGVIRGRLEPPKLFEVTAACVICGAKSWTDTEGGSHPYPIALTYPTGEADILATARATCRACDAVWKGSRELRELRWSIDEREAS